MPSVAFNPRLPNPPHGDGYQVQLNRALTDVLRDLGTRLDLLAEGRLEGAKLDATSVPTTGTYKRGDFIRKSDPVEAGSSPNKYVIAGWLCTTGGPAGTFVFKECRYLTGN